MQRLAYSPDWFERQTGKPRPSGKPEEQNADPLVRGDARMSAATVQTIPRPEQDRESLTARCYPNRIPDGEYLALCTHVHHDQHSRNYGERVYLDFQIFDGEYQGKIVRMFLRPSVFPTSNFYRSWAIAHGGPPRSRNTKMSPRLFKGKLFRVLTTTVKPKHRIAAEDGKMRPGPFLPATFWYSKVACLLSLETTNEAGDFAPPAPRVFLTDFSRNPFSSIALFEGTVGRRELGVSGNPSLQ